MNCFTIFDRLTRLGSEQISVTTQNISLFTNCEAEEAKVQLLIKLGRRLIQTQLLGQGVEGGLYQ